MSSPECIGKFGEYEVWESTDSAETEWHVTNEAGDIILPGDRDLLRALMLIAARQGTGGCLHGPECLECSEGIRGSVGFTYLECHDCNTIVFQGPWISHDDLAAMNKAHRMACAGKAGGSNP